MLGQTNFRSKKALTAFLRYGYFDQKLILVKDDRGPKKYRRLPPSKTFQSCWGPLVAILTSQDCLNKTYIQRKLIEGANSLKGLNLFPYHSGYFWTLGCHFGPFMQLGIPGVVGCPQLLLAVIRFDYSFYEEHSFSEKNRQRRRTKREKQGGQRKNKTRKTRGTKKIMTNKEFSNIIVSQPPKWRPTATRTARDNSFVLFKLANLKCILKGKNHMVTDDSIQPPFGYH